MKRKYFNLRALRTCCLAVALSIGLSLPAQTEPPTLTLGNHAGNPVTLSR